MQQTSKLTDRPLTWHSLVVALLLTALALAIRLPRLDVFITPDEPKWVCRSVNFYRGLRAGDLTQTRQTGHPGVITMWLGAPLMDVSLDEPWLEVCRNPSISDIIEEHGPERPRELGRLLFAARRGVVLFTSICLGLSVLLLARLFGLRIAALAGVLLLLDPFLTAHSRLLHLDAVTTHLMLLGTLCLMLARRSSRWVWWVLSGAASGLAVINKSPAMFMIAFAGLVIGSEWLTKRSSFQVAAGRMALWLGALTLAAFVAWPAMWVEPRATLKLVLDTAFFYAGHPHANSNYFWGAPRPDPGVAFYPVALAFRLTPLSMLGLVLASVWLVRKHERRTDLWVVGTFVLFYAVFMTLGQKKFDRYLLPVLPFVHILAAVGLWGAVGWLCARFPRRLRQWAMPLTVAVLVVGLAFTGSGVLARRPYYLTYYNPLLGGIRAARHVLLVGWGEGLEQAAAYLNSQLDERSGTASSRALPGFAPFYDGSAVHESSYDPATVRYVVSYINEVQRRLEPAMLGRYYDRGNPIHVVAIDGIDYVYVYENQATQTAIDIIATNADPERDAVLLGRPSTFSEDYAGDLPVYVVDPLATQDEVLEELDQIRGVADRVWFVDYWHKNPSPLARWVEHQLRTHGAVSAREEPLDVVVTAFELDDEVSFLDRAPARQVDIDYGPLVLESYALAPGQGRFGSGAGISFTWRVEQPIDHYYQLYLHVLDDAGQRWGQGDTWLLDESLRPTVEWVAGSRVEHHAAIQLAPEIMPGRYRMLLGLRDRLGDEHPVARNAAGQELGLEVDLGEIEVLPSPWFGQAQTRPMHDETISLAQGLDLVGWGQVVDDIYPDERLAVVLYWRAVGETRPDYAVELSLVGADGEAIALERDDVSTAYPTSAWRSGELLAATYGLTVPADAPWSSATLQVRLASPSGEPNDSEAELAEIAVRGRLLHEPQPEFSQRATLGDQIVFLGYDLDDQASPDGVASITLYWQALEDVGADYTVFRHLLDASGLVKGQLDSPPMGGRRPTSTWRAGDYVAEHYAVPVDADAAPGDYRVEIGMYEPANDNQRVPLAVDGQRQQDDRLLLDTPVRIVAATG